jgi:hypothetical protein
VVREERDQGRRGERRYRGEVMKRRRGDSEETRRRDEKRGE